MKTVIKTFGEPDLVRTIKNRTLKLVFTHTQPPVGMVICPHCHEETNIPAQGIFNAIGAGHPLQEYLTHAPITLGKQNTVCIKCTGNFYINKKDGVLVISPGSVGRNILDAEAILDRKKLAAQPRVGPDFI
jgi:hypothetical protein